MSAQGIPQVAVVMGSCTAGGAYIPATPTRELSFLEKATGAYTLSSWSEANRPIVLGARIVEGTLEIDRAGIADWTVLLEQTSTPDPGNVRMTARGRILLDSNEIAGVPGGEFNNTHHLDAKWGQVRSDNDLALRGWDAGSPEDRFKISLDTQSSGKQCAAMTLSSWTEYAAICGPSLRELTQYGRIV